MDIRTLIKRSKRGVSENKHAYAISTVSLAVAFLCLATALLAITNLSQMTNRWNQSHRLTVYLREGARSADIQQLRLALTGSPEIERVEYLDSHQAREAFLKDIEAHSEFQAVPEEAFPASLELHIAGDVSSAHMTRLAKRITHFLAVEDIETYAASFKPLEVLLSLARGAAGALALLVALCVIAVVANTVRLAVSTRAEEMYILKLCGATDRFVRSPLLLEGAFQGFLASTLAMLVLGIAFMSMRAPIDAALFAFMGVHPSFLSIWSILLLVVAATAMGVLGSFLSVRRHLAMAT
ncbi:MAG: hypothetical protein H6714_10365 [Myxococcales bacterium]|nr:hypothetical protein [Myxococcales bacterium]